MVHDLWYKNAIVYCLDVGTFLDANGDGVGDFKGLMRRLEYLAGLGVTCIWLMPFQPTPDRDDGYDVSDYYGVDPKHGTLGEFVEFAHEARSMGLRIIADLVVNHTSNEHPWFREARRDPGSRYRDWYVWSKKRPAGANEGMVFPGVQKSTWTYDREARAYYFHRFYEFQPDLNTENPEVEDEIKRIMGFWLQLGVSGFRVDAVPFVIAKKGAGRSKRAVERYGMLREMRDFLQWRLGDAVLLGEANVLPRSDADYFGEDGDRLQMVFNFQVNQHLFYALATTDARPLAGSLEATRARPATGQWAHFLRNHDELDLGRLTGPQRERVFEALGPEPRMQLYGRGIRRRLAPMLDGDRRRIELAYSLLFTLPGTPVVRYGDEIGMGDDLDLPERASARTPMQWSSAKHGGFSRARRTILPAIADGPYGYKAVNAADQRRERDSLLNWTERLIRMRKECPEIGWGDFEVLTTDAPSVLALRYEWRDNAIVTLHNFAGRPQDVRLTLPVADRDRELTNLLSREHSRPAHPGARARTVALEPYGYRWYRVGGMDEATTRRSW